MQDCKYYESGKNGCRKKEKLKFLKFGAFLSISTFLMCLARLGVFQSLEMSYVLGDNCLFILFLFVISKKI